MANLLKFEMQKFIQFALYFCFLFSTLGLSAQIKYLQSTIHQSLRSDDISADDMDGDGDIDILIADGNLQWLENDGNENFTTHLITDNFKNCEEAYMIDVNGDGHMDVIATATLAKDVAWFENDGNQNFTKHIVDGNVNFARGLAGIDIDEDGDLDLVASGSLEGKTYWYENDGNENFTKHTIDSNFSGYNVAAGDIDGDGIIDVAGVNASGDKIVWWQNDGEENFTRFNLPSSFLNYVIDIKIADIDGDGDMDLTATSLINFDVLWWRHNDNGSFTKITVDNNYRSPHSVWPTDYDGDGDIDLLTVSATVHNNIAVFENNGSENFTKVIVATNYSGRDAFPVDIDQDGDIDILGAGEGKALLLKACTGTDSDGDEWGDDCDCNDGNGAIYPGAAKDCNGEDNDCNGTVDQLEETEAPTVNCQDITVKVDENGEYILTAADVYMGGTDNCSTVSFSSLSQSLFQCADVGSSFAVTVKGVDEAGNEGTCMANVTVADNIIPEALCHDITIQLDGNGQVSITPNQVDGVIDPSSNNLMNSFDNCGVSLSLDKSSFDCNNVGTNTIVMTAEDPVGNSATCNATVTVEDTSMPTAACSDHIVTFNGEDEILVSPSVLFDAANSVDVCGSISLETSADISVTCDQIGTSVPTTIIVNDGNGNQGSCVANIIVEGLECGWTNTFGVGCDGDNGASYDPNSGAFTIDSDGCNAAYPYTGDGMNFVAVELCGDSYIKAQITNIDGSGFAGLMMKNDLNTNSQKIALGTNMVNKIRKEVRIQAGYPAWPQELFSTDKFWIKIERTGYFFKAFASTDDVTYIPIIFQAIQMDDCIQAGLYLYSSTPGDLITAEFENVDYGPLGGGNLASLPNTVAQSESNQASFSLNVFPNPATELINVRLDQVNEEEVFVNIYNQQGKLVLKEMKNDHAFTLNTSHLPAGSYFMTIQQGANTHNQKIIITK